MKVVGDSIGRQYYREIAEGNFRASYGLTKEDTVKMEKADVYAYNVDSLYNVAPLTQKQKVISAALSRATIIVFANIRRNGIRRLQFPFPACCFSLSVLL